MSGTKWERKKVGTVIAEHGGIQDFDHNAEDLIVKFRDGHKEKFIVKWEFVAQDTPMVEFGIREAQEEKWKAGQIKYGGSMPVNPLAHMYEELIDALNYAENAGMNRTITPSEQALICDALRSIAVMVRGRHFEKEKQ